MSYGSLVGKSLKYATEAVIGNWKKWILLIIATILLGIPLAGYSLKVLRGEIPAPEVNNWGTLFIDGIKYLIIMVIYMIPAMIVFFGIVGPSAFSSINPEPMMAIAAIGNLLFGLLLFAMIVLITLLFAIIGVVRFARTGIIWEAFKVTKIAATIGKIGWGTYITALIIMVIIIGIIDVICSLIPVIGVLIVFILIPFITIFQARYVCLLYDSAGAE
jgi:hypothetical protein